MSITLKNVQLKNVTISPYVPPPVLNYGWTYDDIVSPLGLVTIYDDGTHLTFAPYPGLDGNSAMIRSKQPITGKKYCEFAVTAQATNSYFAFGVTTQVPQQFYNPGASAVYTGSAGCSLSYQGVWINGTATSTQDRYHMDTGQRIGFAIDVDAQKVWMSKDGTWVDGQPSSGTGESFTVPFAGPYYFGNMHYTCLQPGDKTCYIYPSAAEQLYAAPSGFTPYSPA